MLRYANIEVLLFLIFGIILIGFMLLFSELFGISVMIIFTILIAMLFIIVWVLKSEGE